MFQKLMWFLFLLFIAAVIGIWFPNVYTAIECTNIDKVCKTYRMNSVLKMKNLVRSVNVSNKRGFSVSVLGVGINNMKYLYCSEYQKKSTNNGKEKFITTYLLVPIITHNPLPTNAMHEYVSQTACEVDKVAIENYLSSGNNEPFVHVVSSSWFRYLWYLVSALLVIIAFLALFKGKVVSEAEEKQYDQMAAEKAEQMHAKVKEFMQRVANIDKTGADYIQKAELKYDSHKINIKKDR